MQSARLALLGAVTTAVLLAAATGVAVADHQPPDAPDGNVSVAVVEANAAGTLSNATAVRRTLAAGATFDPPYLLPGDRLLVELRSPGLTRAYEASDGANATERLFRAVNETDANLSVAQFAVTPERRQTFVSLRRSDVRVVPDPANETFFLRWNTANTTLVDDDGDRLANRDLDHLSFRVVLEAPAGNGSRQLSTADLTFEHLDADVRAADAGSPSAEFDLNSSPAVVGADGRTLSLTGTTTVRANETLTVRTVGRDGAPSASTRVRTTPTNASAALGPSRFAATLRLGTLSTADSFRLAVDHANRTLLTRHVVVGSPPRLGNVSAAVVTEGDRAGDVRVTATVHLPDEGLVAVGDDTRPAAAAVPADETVTRTVYAGDEAVEDGRVFVFLLWDRDESGDLSDADESWHVQGDPDLSRRVPVETPSAETPTATEMPPTPTPTPHPPDTPTDANADDTEPTVPRDDRPTTTTETGTPGFGVLAAVTAVVASLLVVAASRRR